MLSMALQSAVLLRLQLKSQLVANTATLESIVIGLAAIVIANRAHRLKKH